MKQSFKILFFTCLIFALFCCNDLNAQISARDSSRMLIIGELEGRIDIRTLIMYPQDLFYFLIKVQESGLPGLLQSGRNRAAFQLTPPGSGPENAVKFIQYRFFESEWSLISALITQQIDFARLESEESAREVVKSNRSIHLLPELLPDHTVTLLCFNCRHPVWGRVKVRQALSYAIDKAGIVRDLLKKRADLARGPFNRDFEEYESSLEEFRYNPKKALQLLVEDGWFDLNADGILEDAYGNHLKLELLYRQGLVLDEQLIRWIKINWNQIGIDVKPRPVNYTEFQALLQSGKYDIALLEHQFSRNIEGLETFFSAGLPEGFCRIQSGKLERYFRLYHQIDNPERRKILMQSIQKVLNEEQPAIFLYFKWLMFNFINRNRLENYLDASGNLEPVSEWQLKAIKR